MIRANRHKRVIAVCGKGGVGKTAFTAMLTRSLLESQKAGDLLVIDADPAMGLPNTLGIQVEKTIGHVRDLIINTARAGIGEDRVDLSSRLDYLVLETLYESDDYAFLAMGRTDSQGCFCSVNDLLKKSIRILSERFDTIVIDGEAGLEQMNRQVMNMVDLLIILSDTSTRGLQTVEHITKMVTEDHVIDCTQLGVVFNRVINNELLLTQAAERIGIEVFGMVPQDQSIVHYDLIGQPLTELPADSLALSAIRDFVANHIVQLDCR
ncbi:Cobyrinic acid ac-diamide synthase [Desulfitobacterium hafniense DCB-2]|uniref:Cobyrinic acid ac-diamide synthase n=1 Tax=Desulfitobacterium hafniense (strain DSM 10664 / DCB-2) TaxID=272564 RepID=B8FZT2_DESHD|nr:AAA family ATPase [Desulfitobacterium hafniense]ACL19156.1 Cobyrinic acid ac-diamide synthase [Desulfitobacterium hafniense DCB-2]